MNKNIINNAINKFISGNTNTGIKLLQKHIKKNPRFYASLDVFNKEPLIKKHKFWSNKNISITPHVAAITDHDSSISYLYERFMDFKKNKKIKSDVDIKLGY